MFDLQDLKILLAVADCGSISKAAQTLGYVQPNVTQRIRNIEKKLGYSLFDRTKHGVALKPTGKIFIHYAQNILQLSREAEHAVKGLAVPEGSLSIGSMETTAYSRLPLLLKRYTQRYPRVSVSLQTGTTEEMIQRVLNYEIDGAFVAGPVHHEQLIEQAVFHETLALISGAGDPLKAAASCTIVAFKNGCYYRKVLIKVLNDYQLTIDRIIDVDSPQSLIHCVAAGIGISIMPMVLASAENALHITPLPQPYAGVDTVFITRKAAPETAALSRFSDMLTVPAPKKPANKR